MDALNDDVSSILFSFLDLPSTCSLRLCSSLWQSRFLLGCSYYNTMSCNFTYFVQESLHTPTNREDTSQLVTREDFQTNLDMDANDDKLVFVPAPAPWTCAETGHIFAKSQRNVALCWWNLSSWDLSHPIQKINCAQLAHVDLFECDTIAEIPSDSFGNCPYLMTATFSGMKNLKRIGSRVFDSCFLLKKVQLSGCSALQEIENGFCMNCKGLMRMELSNLNSLTRIGSGFLVNCQSITKIEFPKGGFRSLMEVGNAFLSRCDALNALDLEGLIAVEDIGSGFLSGCCELLSVHHLDVMKKSLKWINSVGFMSGSPAKSEAKARKWVRDALLREKGTCCSVM